MMDEWNTELCYTEKAGFSQMGKMDIAHDHSNAFFKPSSKICVNLCRFRVAKLRVLFKPTI
jgi:hypothetical protein